MSANGRLTSAPRVYGHDAISAEFVAAFLDGEEGTWPDLTPCRQCAELGDGRHVGIDRTAAARRLGDHRREPVIGLRADDEIYRRRPRLGFRALGLGYAAGERDHRPRAVHTLEAANVRIGLFGSLLADVAGVEDDQVRVLIVACRAQTLGAQ
jgi:hypothetical protein